MPEATESYDLIIRGGTIVDGTGAPSRAGDIGIRDGLIAAVGEVEGTAERELDASGAVVAPGFVDIHTHYDAQILWDRNLTVSPWHGVTSVVMGNCGFGVAPTRPEHRDLIMRTLENVEGMSLEALRTGLGEGDWPFESFPEYLDAIEARGSAINVAVLVGHTPIRMYVMGPESTEREATDDEVAQMRALVAEAIEAGAVGLATSKAPPHMGYDGRPVPSRLAAFDELLALAEPLGEMQRGIVQSALGPGLLFDELSELQQRTGRPVSWTALLADAFGPEGHRRVLQMHEEFQAKGIEIIPQVSCRPLQMEYQFSAPFPLESMECFKPVLQADREGKKRIYADPEFRTQLKDPAQLSILTGDWSRTVISECPTEPDLEERNLSEVAEERGMHPVDLALDLALASDLEARFRVAMMNTTEASVAELLTHPTVTLGLSDAGAHAAQLCDAGFSTHLLGYWVREKEVLTLEAAVRLLTSRAADVFGITDRGRLEVGLAADVVVFDPDTVACGPLRRVEDLPAGADRLITDAIGIRAVVVNGVVLREDDRDNLAADGPLPGKLLRGGAAA
jgi:N-acyl-D-aspartate/D-glutamate deacylase